MDYRTRTAVRCSQTVLDDNPLLSLFDAIEAEQNEPGLRLCCVHCQAAITTEKDKIEVNAQHTFRVTNPSGINFNIACFKDAWGCGIYGQATDMHTWFPGFSWQFAYCLACEAHLGWFYKNTSAQHFFGLMAEKLIATQNER